MRKNKSWKKNNDQVSKEEQKSDYKKDFKKQLKKDNSIICYKCNKHGHVKKKCPLAKKFSKFSKKKKGKARKVTWSDSEDESSEENEKVEEIKNLCLMAREDEHSSDGKDR